MELLVTKYQIAAVARSFSQLILRKFLCIYLGVACYLLLFQRYQILVKNLQMGIEGRVAFLWYILELNIRQERLSSVKANFCKLSSFGLRLVKALFMRKAKCIEGQIFYLMKVFSIFTLRGKRNYWFGASLIHTYWKLHNYNIKKYRLQYVK